MNCLSRKDFCIYAFKFRHMFLNREDLSCSLTSFMNEAYGKFPILYNPYYGLCQAGGFAGWDQDTCHTMLDNFNSAAAVCSYDGHFHGHGLNQGSPERFAHGWLHQQVNTPVDTADVINEASKDDFVCEPQTGHQLFHLGYI